MGRNLGVLLSRLVQRNSRMGMKVRCHTMPQWLVRTKGDERFQPVQDVETLRLLIKEFVRFSPERKLTFQVQISRVSWAEVEGRVNSEKNSFTFDVDAKGRVTRSYKAIPLTETWMEDPSRVDAAAGKVGAIVFDAIEAVIREGLE